MRLIGLAVILALSLALAALAAEAQPAGGKVYRIGFLQTVPDTPALNYTEAFRQGLRDHGYAEGQNIVIEHLVSRTPKDNPARLADLLGRKIDILVTWTTPALVAAKKATSTIPTVGYSGDPIQTGLVASLARPGGNITGLAILTDELELKNLQLLKEAFPGVVQVHRLQSQVRQIDVDDAAPCPRRLPEGASALPADSKARLRTIKSG